MKKREIIDFLVKTTGVNKEDTELPEQFDEIKWDKTYNVNMIYNKYGKIESIHIEENQ